MLKLIKPHKFIPKRIELERKSLPNFKIEKFRLKNELAARPWGLFVLVIILCSNTRVEVLMGMNAYTVITILLSMLAWSLVFVQTKTIIKLNKISNTLSVYKKPLWSRKYILKREYPLDKLLYCGAINVYNYWVVKIAFDFDGTQEIYTPYAWSSTVTNNDRREIYDEETGNRAKANAECIVSKIRSFMAGSDEVLLLDEEYQSSIKIGYDDDMNIKSTFAFGRYKDSWRCGAYMLGFYCLWVWPVLFPKSLVYMISGEWLKYLRTILGV